MKFRNNKKQDIMVRVEKEGGGYQWISAEAGEVVDVPKEVGLTYGLTQVDDSEDEEQEEQESEPKSTEFKEKLQEVDGVGPKTADDVIEIYNTEEQLLKDIEDKDQIPVRNDVEKKLRKHYS